MTIIDQLNHLAETARTKRVRYSEVLLVCDAAKVELARLREIEWMYNSLG